LREAPAAFGRLCVETSHALYVSSAFGPAAFGRLCVETNCSVLIPLNLATQPPSGGCVLKHNMRPKSECRGTQPPSGGCVLKLAIDE